MGLNAKEVSMIINILELVTKYGVPAVKDIVDNWDNDSEITPELINELKNSIKPADDLW